MNREKKTEIKVGITALFALLLFIFVYGWAKNFSFNSDDKRLSIGFPTAAGLEIGDMVSVNGVRKGMVESIDAKNNIALVEVKFTEDVVLKEDAEFAIMMLDLMGGKKIEIKSGDSETLIDYGSVQSGMFAGDISTAMATLNSVESDLIEVINELKTTLKTANNLFGENDFNKNLNTTIDNVQYLTKNLNDLIIQNKESLNKTLQNTEEITNRANRFLEENNGEIVSAVANLNSVLENSNQLISKLSLMTDEIKASENNLGKFLYDEDLMDDLKASLQQIKEMSTIINEQLKSGGLEVKADVDLF